MFKKLFSNTKEEEIAKLKLEMATLNEEIVKMNEEKNGHLKMIQDHMNKPPFWQVSKEELAKMTTDELTNLSSVLTKKSSEITKIISERNLCIVCQERSRNTLFSPCLHYNCCNTCANTLIKCPTCRNLRFMEKE
ncbi:hypothetical protein PPL_07513 [Heterostelium album PN500]|uniref:RING-type domain-containing protein n=1 Tax=Heterostelium pallidum (strain ATCC 26659 / Pp 5 / PN500) TaxID=670386 RepID=D3BG62_HETP5|nr:hypothetical protein PPL_07513 [Heterostelium album PN500]EFA79654.1 hypothetical protein PPL_07513 [Heterostelium album PN500]|eukprot:XP_020431775.1 hypothetical protein PPL_07513 [Heterostelium album PN500]